MGQGWGAGNLPSLTRLLLGRELLAQKSAESEKFDILPGLRLSSLVFADPGAPPGSAQFAEGWGVTWRAKANPPRVYASLACHWSDRSVMISRRLRGRRGIQRLPVASWPEDSRDSDSDCNHSRDQSLWMRRAIGTFMTVRG